MSQYIGKTISLISVTDNRYVGLLENIDSEKGTVTLRSVRCFGSEGRKNWGPEEIYPNPAVYDSVQFNGNDVKDLSILEVRLEDVQPVLPPQMQQQQQQQHVAPPVSESQQQQQQLQQPQKFPSREQVPVQQQATASVPVATESREEKLPAAMAGYGVYAPPSDAQQSVVPEVAVNREQKLAQRKEHANTSGGNNNNSRRPHRDRNVEIPKNDFDFQFNNAKFSKENSEAEQESSFASNRSNENSAENEPFYDKKSSFFDTISTSAEASSNMRWQDEKELNLDTFGQASARPRRGRGGRGGNRGGQRGNYRGGNRGGNRGGYRNYRNNNNYNNNNGSNYDNNGGNRQQDFSSQGNPYNVEF
ncbi:Scd6p KNAG_0B00910 [Huiozyma naganishii CBS 8797]|uniref:DFDF domain-containing protein n=1 Tax=Huiozyma naganishii (strain ATCC MYA-139 / BCRC 22969 / CBS 8797 / KCTC 17520 / NBRC 10181 / NCYC 3082 / Yp74L-3) TaxID=1071383 RepID=J7RG76_HUIN7|nr:hypothetical protein KNAG_0B00910 [Kazachstania naganishii CBS 8797]CCK68538.1 hypothetical protein KNAG_0B00910 [Kazachstania naganishii CBS 8797]